MKKRWVASTALAAGILPILTLTSLANPRPGPSTEASGGATSQISERSAYQEVALPSGSASIGSDPSQIALRVFGHAEPVEGNFQERVVLVEQTAHRALVALIQTGLADDSVEGSRYRLEFVREGDRWRLDWAGRQVRCYPGRGSPDWTAGRCQ